MLDLCPPLCAVSGARPTLLLCTCALPPPPIALDWFVIFSIGGLTCPLRLVFVVMREELTDNHGSGGQLRDRNCWGSAEG